MYAKALSGLMDKPRDLPAGGEEEAAGAQDEHILQEWAVVQRAQALDETALATLYSTYYPRIYNYAFLQLGDVQAAEDLASEVMLKMLESIQKYRFKGAPFSAWVFRIARNRIIDVHRRRKRRGEVDLSEPMASDMISPQTLAERALDRGQLQLALRYLTDDQRQVIVLKFIEGFDNASIARILHRSEGAVKSLQHRALLSLRRIMAGEWY
jgi:RNA polymerase sigma-70 factor (ECF subfamily)